MKEHIIGEFVKEGSKLRVVIAFSMGTQTFHVLFIGDHPILWKIMFKRLVVLEEMAMQLVPYRSMKRVIKYTWTPIW